MQIFCDVTGRTLFIKQPAHEVRHARDIVRLNFFALEEIAQPEGDEALFVFPPQRQFHFGSRRLFGPALA